MQGCNDPVQVCNNPVQVCNSNYTANNSLETACSDGGKKNSLHEKAKADDNETRIPLPGKKPRFSPKPGRFVKELKAFIVNTITLYMQKKSCS